MSLLKKGGYTSYVSSRPENDPAAEIQNVSSSRVYIFGNDEADETGIEDSTLEMTELRPRNKNKRSYASTKSGPHQSKKTETIDRDVLPTDSLQSVSLQYGCTVRMSSVLLTCAFPYNCPKLKNGIEGLSPLNTVQFLCVQLLNCVVMNCNNLTVLYKSLILYRILQKRKILQT